MIKCYCSPGLGLKPHPVLLLPSRTRSGHPDFSVGADDAPRCEKACKSVPHGRHLCVFVLSKEEQIKVVNFPISKKLPIGTPHHACARTNEMTQ